MYSVRPGYANVHYHNKILLQTNKDSCNRIGQAVQAHRSRRFKNELKQMHSLTVGIGNMGIGCRFAVDLMLFLSLVPSCLAWSLFVLLLLFIQKGAQKTLFACCVFGLCCWLSLFSYDQLPWHKTFCIFRALQMSFFLVCQFSVDFKVIGLWFFKLA